MTHTTATLIRFLFVFIAITSVTLVFLGGAAFWSVTAVSIWYLFWGVALHRLTTSLYKDIEAQGRGESFGGKYWNPSQDINIMFVLYTILPILFMWIFTFFEVKEWHPAYLILLAPVILLMIYGPVGGAINELLKSNIWYRVSE